MGVNNMGRFIPRGFEPHGRRRKGFFHLLLACTLLGFVPVGSFAQPTDALRTFYVPAQSFNIPFNTQNDPRVVDVILWVSTDRKEYKYVDTVKPAAGRFFFPSHGEGWYYFIVQTRDQNQTLRPADVRETSPSIRVCVDTQNPVIEELTGEQSPNGLPGIRWKIKEANLKEIWADYRSSSGGEWLPLFLQPQLDGSNFWKPAHGGELDVRMQALDQAGHRSEVKTLRMRVAENVARMQPPADAPGPGKVLHVKNKTFQLQYELDDQTVGPSQVSSVDIWKLHPGQPWEKCTEKGTRTGPASVTVNATGRWGFRLIPRSGVGLAERDPRQGDAPDIWVEVDDKPPQVRVTNVTVTQEPDGGYLTVYWKADDTFLRATPITILMATNPQANDWSPFPKATDLPNTGSWRQKTDDLNLGNRYEFSLKVTAIDEAGNVGSDQWREVVKVDLKIPRIKSIDVKPGGASVGDGQESYRPSQPAPYGGGSPGNPSLPPASAGSPNGVPTGNSVPPRPLSNPTNGTNGGFSSPAGPGSFP